MNDNTRQFDMTRLTKSKLAVDLCPNSIRQYARNGLPLYRRGRAVFFSKTELEQYIRNPDSFKKSTAKRK
jgi:hypothetical protein